MLARYNVTDYLRRARDNKDFSDRLKPKDGIAVGWALVAYFYSAVHAVNAYGAKYNRYFNNHKERNSEVDRNPVFDEVSAHFSELGTLAWQSRYNPSKTYTVDEYKQARESAEAVLKHVEHLLSR